jgi:hypothetical protein
MNLEIPTLKCTFRLYLVNVTRASITQPNKKKAIFFSHFLNSTFFHRFSAPYLVFFPARQVSGIVLNESFKSYENVLIEWLQKDTTKYFLKFKVYVVSLVINVVSKTGFGIFLAHLVCLKYAKSEIPGKFQVHVSRITLISSS